jgi:hypothetical protein
MAAATQQQILLSRLREMTEGVKEILSRDVTPKQKLRNKIFIKQIELNFVSDLNKSEKLLRREMGIAVANTLPDKFKQEFIKFHGLKKGAAPHPLLRKIPAPLDSLEKQLSNRLIELEGRLSKQDGKK